MSGIATTHHALTAWAAVMARIRHEIAQRGVHAAQTVVLLPYAQLMREARRAWNDSGGLGNSGGAAYFVPRFETTQNWVKTLSGFDPAADDIRQDAALDAPTAAQLLARAGLAAHQGVLATRLMEAAWSLARIAAAVPPGERSAWGQRLAPSLAAGMDTPVLALEAAVARIALAWAANSSYATDVLFSAEPALLVVLQGFQAEPLAMALQQRLGERCVSLPLDELSPAVPSAALACHVGQDGEDEAHKAAACVMQALAQGISPVALVAVDRVLTRRVRAMLGNQGVAVRDETGWKLSTTRAAATLMSLLRASRWDAPTDDVLDWLKNAPAFDERAVTRAEIEVRATGQRDWPSAPHLTCVPRLAYSPPPEQASDALVAQANTLRQALQRARPLAPWLNDLRDALQNAGQWAALVADAAGQAVAHVLRLAEGQSAALAHFAAPLSAAEFTAWVVQTLEFESFMPAHPAQEQVVILPLSQLLGRALPAVVLAGCDEVRLPVSPEPPGLWTPAQRALLGLPSREALAQAAGSAWQYALLSPHLDVLWRASEGGERLMPSGFVQTLLLQSPPGLADHLLAADPRVLRALAAQPLTMPAPQGHRLPVHRLSASSYEDLRRCPYRFFALRQLKLKASDELDVAVGKRDFGNWVHQVLKRFHEALDEVKKTSNTPLAPDLYELTAMIDIAADEATENLGLTQAEFLPFAAAWPRVRQGYLQWLAGHQATGAVFTEAEAWKEMPLGSLTLVGKIDRLDTQSDGHMLVIDYKTEGRTATAERVKSDAQDTQLAFYAALLHDDTLGAAYVNVGEKDPTKTYAQTDIVALRDQLVQGVMTDMARIAQGAPLPAMGEGKACDFCDARGLCRKDMWSGVAL